jgi:hypothetical protein
MTLQSTTVELILFLETHYVLQPEQLRIGIDDTVLSTVMLPQEIIKITTNLDPGPHKFWIELCDKVAGNVLRSNGELIDDTYVKIKNLSINGSMMHYLLNDNGYTSPDWEHHADVADWFKENCSGVPERIAKSSHLNLKGFYYFEFSLPLKEYLNQHIEIAPTYKKYYNSPLDRYQELKNKLINSQGAHEKNTPHRNEKV